VDTQVRVDGVTKPCRVPAATGWVGQWWKPRAQGGEPAAAYAPRAPIAWYASHTNLPDGSFDAYRFAYVHRVDLTVPARARTMVLPKDRRILIFAAVRWNDLAALQPTEPIVR
jgi:alpha-mannosidase